MHVDQNGDLDVEHTGDTDIDWDSSETIGGICRACGWSWVGDNWWTRLDIATEEEHDAEDEEPEGSAIDEEVDEHCCPHCYSPDDWEYVGLSRLAKCPCGATWTAA
jgi:hypothetical protein